MELDGFGDLWAEPRCADSMLPPRVGELGCSPSFVRSWHVSSRPSRLIARIACLTCEGVRLVDWALQNEPHGHRSNQLGRVARLQESAPAPKSSKICLRRERWLPDRVKQDLSRRLVERSLRA